LVAAGLAAVVDGAVAFRVAWAAEDAADWAFDAADRAMLRISAVTPASGEPSVLDGSADASPPGLVHEAVEPLLAPFEPSDAGSLPADS
jgi:hypothetical protein